MVSVDHIEPSKHIKGRFLVFLTSGIMLKVGEGELLEFSLRPGLALDEELLSRLIDRSKESQTKQRAARMIGARPLSKHELVDRLVRKGEEDAQAQKAADWLEDLGAVNDLEYARMVVRHYDRRGYGPQKLREELYRRKVPRELWDEALEESGSEYELAVRFLESKFRSRTVTEKERQKQANALRRRGFSWEAVRDALEQFPAQDEYEPEWE